MPHFKVALLLAVSIMPRLVLADSAFTLEQVMHAPFATHLVSAAKAKRVAWVVNAQGRRNVWMAEAPEWRGRQLTQFKDDDGQEIDELAWAPDGSALYFVRGGDFESGRENPNPAWALARPQQEIWAWREDGGAVQKLTEGRFPSLSPASKRVWFVRKGQLYSMQPDGMEVKSELDVQGAISEVTWSPDGSQMAFANQRESHSFIGVYTVASKALLFLDASVDSDGSPTWSPDGRQIAFVRIPAAENVEFFTPQRDGYPWSIRIARADGQQAREIFHASAGVGSVFHEIVAERQIFWTAGNRIVFPWERTGWLHLFSTDVKGGAVRELTPGEGEVEHVSMADDRATLIYSSNIGDVDRRHVFKLAADQADAPVRVTHGDGIEWSPMVVADTGTIVALRSTYKSSAHAALVTANGGMTDLAPDLVPQDFPAGSLVEPEAVTVTAADGLRLHAQLFHPRGAGRHPALVFFHGGSRRQMLLGFHYMYYYSNAYAMNQYLASLGYVVLSVNYRSGIGYGLNFREAIHFGADGASEYNDVQGAGLYLKARSDVDPKRIGVWGGSYGGYLTALALARSSDLFAAGVDFHGVHDWNLEIPNFQPSYDAKAHPDFARIAFESSPLAAVDTWRSPVLLIHGDDDRNVPFQETVRLVEELRKRNVDFEQLIFPNEIHDFLLWRDWVKAYGASADFFARKLR